jgi:FKBP-type peptidyl-prolyl cis-trans isomerase
VRRVVQEAPDCRIRSRRDDVLEINYTAHIGSLQGVIYDASEFRGTGRPYQMVLGSGDMIPGVDQGLANMCPGEIRQIEIPPSLAYGAKGNKLFRIPPNARLIWEIELVSVNSMRQQQQDDSNDT